MTSQVPLPTLVYILMNSGLSCEPAPALPESYIVRCNAVNCSDWPPVARPIDMMGDACRLFIHAGLSSLLRVNNVRLNGSRKRLRQYIEDQETENQYTPVCVLNYNNQSNQDVRIRISRAYHAPKNVICARANTHIHTDTHTSPLQSGHLLYKILAWWLSPPLK